MDDLADIAATCHRGRRSSRGVAMGLCRTNARDRKVDHLSIGNVELRIYQDFQEHHTISFNGTLGKETERYQVKSYPFNAGTPLVLFGDGISGKFKLSRYLLDKPPSRSPAISSEISAATTMTRLSWF